MWLADVLVDVIEGLAPPGRTAFSVSVAADCEPYADSCEGARHSTFYGAWVRQETPEEAKLRYAVIAAAIERAATGVICRTVDDEKIEGCVPFGTHFKKQRWGARHMALAAVAAATYESGFREDIQVGRGRAKKESDDGGRGRGPGLEGCLMQPHPSVAWKYAPDVDPELHARAAGGDRKAREVIVQTLLGRDEEALVRCFTTGMRMLVVARASCAWSSKGTNAAWAMYSMYGTGTSCTSANDGKTALRARLYENLIARDLRRPKIAAGSAI